RALAGEDIDVPSPTFGLVQAYDTDPPLLHADLYRLESAEEVMELGLEDGIGTGVLIVEWPEHGEGYLPRRALHIKAENAEGERVWRLRGDGDWVMRLTEKDFA
ncbi:MAG: tRNA (adenosine(37)-N6)-threonylcarbamoyltransferase complex ATPase subunit type 1 TsaE, partial [Pseudomonadota bacterium]